MIIQLKDKWFEENGYWEWRVDKSSRAKAYIIHIKPKMKELLINFFGETTNPNMRIVDSTKKTFTTRLVLPEEVLDYLNNYLFLNDRDK